MFVEKGKLDGYDSLVPDVTSDFNALVTSSIIQSVPLWSRGG
jgi:hypothetical protein